jgi:signal transduction histidine kinase
VAGELRDFEVRQLMPLMTQLQVTLRDIHDVTMRVQRADDQVRAGAERVGAQVRRASIALRWPALSAWALAQGVRAAVAAFRARSAASSPSCAHAPVTPDLLDEARLVSEGGHEPADAAFRM